MAISVEAPPTAQADTDPRQRPHAPDISASDLHTGEGLFLPNRQLLPQEFVQGIGAITCVDSSFVQAPYGVFRRRQTLEIETDWGIQYVRRTLPGMRPPGSAAIDNRPKNIVHFPGFTEMPDAGTAKALHDSTAGHFPNTQVITFGTDGVSLHGPTLGWREGISKGFGEMAHVRRRLIRALCGGDSVSIVGTSMGTVLCNKLVRQNLQAAATDEDDAVISIASLIKVSHALVPPERVLRDIGLSFVPHMVVNGTKEALRHPREARNVLPVMGGLRRSAPAMTGNLMNLRRGTTAENVLAVVSTHPTGYLLDSQDPLCQQKHCLDLAEKFPDTVRVWVRPKGHASSLDAAGTAQEIANMQAALA